MTFRRYLILNASTARRAIAVSFCCLGLLALTGCDKPKEEKKEAVKEVAKEPPKEIALDISSDADFPAYVPDELTVPTGAHVKLSFHHTGMIMTQSHDWVLVKPDTMEAVETAGIAAGEQNGWLQKDDPNVLAATPLIGKGDTTTVEFTAPAPGDYPFMCTTPGHGEDMHGILHVTPN